MTISRFDNDSDMLAALEECGALRRGHFKLSSGRHSADYVQCALLLERPRRARRIGAALAARFSDLDVEGVAAPALGGLLVGHEVAAALDLPFSFTERKGGEMCLRRGFSFPRGSRTVIIEDVVTTGKSTLETIAVLTRHGASVVGVGSIIDRTGERKVFDLPFHSLLDLALETFAPGECPQCREGRALESPGSRSS